MNRYIVYPIKKATEFTPNQNFVGGCIVVESKSIISSDIIKELISKEAIREGDYLMCMTCGTPWFLFSVRQCKLSLQPTIQ